MRDSVLVEDELERVQNEKLATHPRSEDAERLYGAEQALLWVLDQDAMAPCRAFGLGVRR